MQDVLNVFDRNVFVVELIPLMPRLFHIRLIFQQAHVILLAQADSLAKAVEEFVRVDDFFILSEDDPATIGGLAGEVKQGAVVFAQVFGFITRLSLAQKW